MDKWETYWRFTVTGLAVWRVSRHLLEVKGSEGKSGEPNAAAEEAGGVRFWAGRAVDLACWVSVWMSSQTAIWVTCGLAGVFLSWLAASGICRLCLSGVETTQEAPGLSHGDEMQARNG